MIKKSIFAGFGGQGILLMGYTLANAAMNEDKFVTYLPSYGAEVRGGTANCTVSIGDEEIASPIASVPDYLTIMNAPSLAKFQNMLRKGGGCLLNTSLVGKQSVDIAQGVDRSDPNEQGAGDQGLMFGYATNETEVLMPAPITYAHRLVKRQSEIRKENVLPWLRPDAKSQVTFRYKEGLVSSIDAVVLSTQHNPDIEYKHLQEAVMENIILPVLPKEWITNETRFHINPTGSFVIGGPVGDCGLTGRKIIVDTYGGSARHGGGAFSGKDPSKVDRSAAYAGRYVAKNIVAAGLADRCEIQVSYAIGVAEPTSIYIETFGTAKIDEDRIAQLVREHFDLRPHAIIDMLGLIKPIYRKTASYGHFGREDEGFSWERTDKADILRDAAGL